MPLTRPVLAALLAVTIVAQRADIEMNTARARALGWTRTGVAPSHKNATLRIALSHSAATRAYLLSMLRAVSDPDSPVYGKHLSRSELRDRAAPVPGASAAVHEWLGEAGLVGRLEGTGDIIATTAPCGVLAHLLGVELSRCTALTWIVLIKWTTVLWTA